MVASEETRKLVTPSARNAVAKRRKSARTRDGRFCRLKGPPLWVTINVGEGMGSEHQ